MTVVVLHLFQVMVWWAVSVGGGDHIYVCIYPRWISTHALTTHTSVHNICSARVTRSSSRMCTHKILVCVRYGLVCSHHFHVCRTVRTFSFNWRPHNGTSSTHTLAAFRVVVILSGEVPITGRWYCPKYRHSGHCRCPWVSGRGHPKEGFVVQTDGFPGGH